MSLANLLQVFIIFLPAFVANAAPVFAKNIPQLQEFSKPINPTLLGKNKTFRGLITGIFAGILVGVILFLLRPFLVQILPVYSDYYNLYSSWSDAIFFGGWLGLGALTGDMVKSFFKRRLGHKPGEMFQPWDGIDYMLGAIIFMLPWYFAGFLGCIFLLIIGPLLSLITNMIAYQIGWKERWY